MESNDKPFRLQIMSTDSVEVEIEKLNEAIEKDPKGKSGYYRWLFFTYLHKVKDYKKSFEYINMAIECCTDEKEQSENYGCLSLWYAWQDKSAESIEPMIKCVELNPEEHEYLCKLGWAYMEIKDYKNALKVFDRLLKMPAAEFNDMNDWQEMYYESFADLYKEDKDYKKANKLYNKLLKEAEDDNTRAIIYSLISDMYRIAENPKDAVSAAAKAVKLVPDSFNFINRLALAQIANKQNEEALVTYKKLSKLKSPEGQDENYFKRKQLVLQGNAYLEENKFQEAIDCYKKSLPLYKDSDEMYEPLQELCGTFFNQRRYKESVPYLRKIIKLWPMKYPRAYTSMATYYYVEEGDYENALNYLSLAGEANHQSPNFHKGNDHSVSATVYAFMGDIYQNKYNDEEKAIEYYNLALTCKPDKGVEGEIYDGLYKIYLDRGDEEKVKEYKEKRSSKNLMLAMFNEPWEAPPKKTLDERLRNPQNTKEEIESLPYHFSNFPKEYMEKHRYKEKLRNDFENDLLTNPKYKEFFDKHIPYYTRGFIHKYVAHKLSLVENSKWYLEADAFEQDRRHREMFYIIELILQKKLFNMQLLWRAEQITIPGIRVTEDFRMWERNPFDCPFLEKITAEETETMIGFLLSGDYEDELYSFMFSWQSYDALMEEDEEGNRANMPEWYNMYDDKMNTGHLLLLPNTRGEKEEAYMQQYYTWKRKQPPVIHPPQPPYVKGPELIFGDEPTYTTFMELFEDDYLCTLQHNWSGVEEPKDKTFSQEAVDDALYILKDAELAPIIEGGLPWQEALIKCANTYKWQKNADALEEAVMDFNMKKELGILQADDELHNTESWKKLADDRAECVLKARKLSGEPRDFNY